MLAPIRAERAEVGWTVLAPIDRFLLAHRKLVMAGAAALALGSLALIPRLSFDFNPLNLVDPRSESASTMLQLMHDPLTTPNTIDVLTPSVAAAAALTPKLEALPEVSTVLSLNSFVPEDQPDKLAILSDLALLIGPTLDAPGARGAALRRRPACRRCQDRGHPAADRGRGGQPGARLADGLDKLSKADAATLAREGEALLGPLPLTLDLVAADPAGPAGDPGRPAD